VTTEPNGVTKWTGSVAVVVGSLSLFGSMIAWTYSLQDRLTRSEAALLEIETQFCAADMARNLMHASDLRNYAVLYQRVFGVEYPTSNAYYPTICNRPIRR
jgi:hypothetical protein